MSYMFDNRFNNDDVKEPFMKSSPNVNFLKVIHKILKTENQLLLKM